MTAVWTGRLMMREGGGGGPAELVHAVTMSSDDATVGP